eukprot:TRINITY_DN14300_c0_g5_i1.p1 TRINITY_DN14300_c0_g5~~TRINITY_DN14300_c0_g5_i1.p1  ORF type:complete len:662 (-),score=132.00 TRINITY_DN14300_c0_g5_i1:191-2176(-)
MGAEREEAVATAATALAAEEREDAVVVVVPDEGEGEASRDCSEGYRGRGRSGSWLLIETIAEEGEEESARDASPPMDRYHGASSEAPAQNSKRETASAQATPGIRRRLASLALLFVVAALLVSLCLAALVALDAEEAAAAERRAVVGIWTAGGADPDSALAQGTVRSLAAVASSDGCRTAAEGESCHDAVTWAMQEGIFSNPAWYAGLNASSCFEDFQMLLHRQARGACGRPCAPKTFGASADAKPAAAARAAALGRALKGGAKQEERGPDPEAPTAAIARRRRAAQMTSCRRRQSGDGDKDLPKGWRCQGNSVGPDKSTVPLPPYQNHYNGSNPLSVQAAPKRSDNYIILIGDWGKFQGPGPCQLAVARKMKEYVAKQRAKGKKLLVVGTVGDNFYWTGASPELWDPVWANVYGTNDPESPLFEVPWLATMGNHDYGDNDPYAFCPEKAPKAEIAGQPYAGQQLNRDRNPSRPAGTESFWLPDYNYHYEIKEVGLELILVDTNYQNVVHNLGAGAIGFREAFQKCGGHDEVAAFMRRVSDAGTELLRQRARLGSASTTVILQHYPEAREAVDNAFTGSLPEGRTTHVIQAFGHWHDQFCQNHNENGTCNMVLTGGGGGCCGGHRAGFTAVHLTDDGGFTVDLDSDEVSMPAFECHWRRRI